MRDLKRAVRLSAFGLAPLLASAVLLAGCGHNNTNGASPTSPTTGGSSTSGESGETIAITSGHLTADEGKSVYLWEGDHGMASSCTGPCASAWPPVLTSGPPKAEGGAMASDLGTIKRSDGGMQVTYKGHPLYYFAGDSSKGQTNGQGSNGFGAKWWLVTPSGTPMMGQASSGSPSSGSSSGGYGSGGY